jgi:RNA polymerase sigma factor (sigma-70 family)
MGGSPGAGFDEFYRSVLPVLVRALTAWTGDRMVAQDLAHDALTFVYRDWARVSVFASPAAWTWRIAINLSRKHARRRRVELRHLPGQVAPEATELLEATPDRRLWAAVTGLPEHQRVAVVLRLLDRPFAEIAETLSVSADHARQLNHRGLKRLRVELQVAADG